jgi:hypothetical protein
VKQRSSSFVAALLLLLSFGISASHAAEMPKAIAQFTNAYCVQCHGAKEQKGKFRIDTLPWSLTEREARENWELVHEYVKASDMPPKKATKLPTVANRKAFLALLKASFAKATLTARAGGTPLRRLNRVEYLNTVRDLFGIRMIHLPLSFPEDVASTEFDTMPRGLFLSPAVMEAYHETATGIADRLVPLSVEPRYKSDYTAETIGGDTSRRWYGSDKNGKPQKNKKRKQTKKQEQNETQEQSNRYLKFTGFNQSGWSGALWDPLLVAPQSGVYRFRLLANAQANKGADGKPLRIGFYAFDPTRNVALTKRYPRERATRVAAVNLPTGKPRWIVCDVPLEAGETAHFYCENRFPEGHYPTGELLKNKLSSLVNKAKADKAPTIELRGLTVEGPVAVLPRVKSFFGSYPPKLNRTELESKLLPLAARAYRRPLTDAEKENLISKVLAHGSKTDDSAMAWHYAIRRIICSPAFLYRESVDTSSESLDQFTLASRLSYFLWSSMPDKELIGLAAAGKLSNPDILAQQTRRLLRHSKSQRFVKHFTGQWLGNRAVATIAVCDNRYKWDENVRYGFVRSTEMLFEEVLRKNLPISTFIDSDFTYANSAMRAVWGMKGVGNLEAVAALQRHSEIWPEPQRISLANLPNGTPSHIANRRGVLGLPGVLTVTGDGVESSPILRGVWALENLFGKHPPPPPKDVPALDVDTSKAKSVRETLAAHTKIESCAKCHRDIDPLGLALENYDAIGGWRNSYVGQKQPIDATAKMPDGTRLDGVASLRKVLLKQPEFFSRCLLVKLLEYGTGRKLSVGDQRVVDEMIKAAPKDGFRFQDMIIAATNSAVFRAK